MGRNFDPAALAAAAQVLLDIANDCRCGHSEPTRRTTCGCHGIPRQHVGTCRPVTPTRPLGVRVAVCGHEAPRAPWGVAMTPPLEDKNKRFGINIRVDEPVRSDFNSRWAFERAKEKFDRLVDAAEAVDWKNKSNTAPLHKVNAVRRRVEDGPVGLEGINLIGESRIWSEEDWF